MVQMPLDSAKNIDSDVIRFAVSREKDVDGYVCCCLLLRSFEIRFSFATSNPFRNLIALKSPKI